MLKMKFGENMKDIFLEKKLNSLENRISRLENPYQTNMPNYNQQNNIPNYQTTQNNAGYNGEMYMM